MLPVTAEQKVAFYTSRGVKPWPPRVETRRAGVRYPFFPAYQYVCSCGELIRNITDFRVRAEPSFHGWKLQHGDNREAVLVLDGFSDMVLTPALEQRLASWADEIHSYQRRTAWFSPDGDYNPNG